MRNQSTPFFREFLQTFSLFFKKKDILAILAFLLLYRLAESQLLKIIALFLLDPRSKGGLGFTTSEVGIIYGTVGVIALVLGGLLGGYAIYRRGLKFWIWIMVCAIHLPDLVFVYLSQALPDNFFLINVCVAVEQFGYGFGFTAYTMFMIMVAEGRYKTVHYAIATGIMALGMMIPAMTSGWLQEQLGYQNFFLWVMAATIPGFVVAGLVKIDPEFGKRKGMT
jgi:PAT family beta-lactamase induction signal transducer AmpG